MWVYTRHDEIKGKTHASWKFEGLLQGYNALQNSMMKVYFKIIIDTYVIVVMPVGRKR